MKRELRLNSDGSISDIVIDDVEPEVELAKRMKADAPMVGARFKKDFTHVASIPPSVVEKIRNETGVNFFDKGQQPAFFAILRRDYPHLMTMPGNPFRGT